MTNSTGTLTLALALLLGGCTATEKKPEAAATTPSAPNEVAEAALDTPPSPDEQSVLTVPPELEAAGFESSYGEVETFTATLKIDATVGSKAFQGVRLEVEDGRTFLVAYRPDDRWRSFDHKRVRVTGVTRERVVALVP